jgi:hypothetical protein
MQVTPRVIICYSVSTNWMCFFSLPFSSDLECAVMRLLEYCEKKGGLGKLGKTMVNMADRMENWEK